MRLWARLAVGAAGLMLAAPSCIGHGRGGGSGEFKAAEIEGVVTVQPPGESAHVLRKGDAIKAGSGLRTGKDSRVRLEGGAERAVELAGETQATIVSAESVALDLGRALAQAGTGSLVFDSRGVGVHVNGGTARLERLLGVLRVGVYSGAARVDLLGRGVDVPAYRELDFAGGIPVDRAPRPLTLRDSDPWDRRLLGDVIEFDRNITQFGNGFNNEFAGRAVAPTFFSPFVGVSNVSFVQGTLDRQPQEPAEVLIGLVLAERLAAKTGSSAQRLYPPMLTERGQGATWGLIAKERGLALPSLLQSVLDAIRRGTSPAPQAIGGGGGGGNPPRPPSPQPTGSPKPKPTGSPTPGPSPTPTNTPCGTLERLLGICPPQSGAQSTGSGTPTPPPDCSVVGILIDPNC